MWARILNRAANAAKAIVALATPVITTFVVDTLADVSASTETWIAGAAAFIVVYLVPNAELTKES